MGYRFLTYESLEDGHLIPGPDLAGGVVGAVFEFRGVVRADLRGGKRVKSIHYEAFEEMAEAELEKIRDEVLDRFDVNDVFIVHRLGEIAVGEASLYVRVLSPHRKSGFAAVDYVVDRIKETVPIWKKERFEDDSTAWR